MTLMHEPTAPEHPETTWSAPEVPPTPSDRRGWWRGAAVVMVVLLALGGATWWLLDSTVPAGDYDEVAAELDTARAALVAAEASTAAAETEAETLGDDLEAMAENSRQMADDLAVVRGRVDALTASNAELRSVIYDATTVAQALALAKVNLNADYVADLQAAGVDLVFHNDLLTQLGEDETIEQWVASEDGWTAYRESERSISYIDDDALDASTDEWLIADIGSTEESGLIEEVWARMISLLLERLESGEVTEP